MNLSIYKEDVFEKYHSYSQIARVLTESWFQEEMYCPSCLNEELDKNPNNTKVTDFLCQNCGNSFQLKSQTKNFSSRVVDGAFSPMVESIIRKQNPNFFFMNYSNESWEIMNLLLVPKFFFSQSIIEKRKPLSQYARRSGWVGCNILLSKLPLFGKIKIIEDSKVISKHAVQQNWKNLFFLNEQKPEKRAWTSDVLLCIEKLNKREFSADEIYGYEDNLSRLHPDNSHIKAKIRQQLQILRDKGILEFKSRGYYKLK
ncbi:MAG: DpnI domain-containing protein [Nanoarchaeota archaeon]